MSLVKTEDILLARHLRMLQTWRSAPPLSIVVLAIVFSLFAPSESTASTGITLMWDRSPETSVIGYKVYVGTTSNFYTQTFDTGNATSFVLTSAVLGQQYYFAVTAYSALAEGPLSAEVTGSLSDSSTPLPESSTPLPESSPSLLESSLSLPLPSPSVPTGWTSEDIGSVSLRGSASESGGTFTLFGNGRDVWGTADTFHFAYQQMTGDGAILARVSSMAGAETWAKIGIMMRATTAADSTHAFMLASIGKGLAFQRRVTEGGLSTHTAGAFVGAPVWLKLTRLGNVIAAYASGDGLAWTFVGQDTFSLPTTVLVGLAVSSHDTSTLAQGTFDQVAVSSGTELPPSWSSQDVGVVGIAGHSTQSSGTFTVEGAGADIWGTADAFQFAWQTLPGDGKLIARVASISGTQAWVKAGVMVRQTLDAGSAHGLMLISAAKGVAFQRRTVSGGLSTSSGLSGSAPAWVKISRIGTNLTASVSSDGLEWQIVGYDTVSLTGAVYFGLVISSHDQAERASATFDNVVLSTDP
jgi:regulation of enolase protein 1 (concanavalin A-like superfamily)